MPLEAPATQIADRVEDLNARFRHHSATAVLEHTLSDVLFGRIAMVSSFGAESVALLHMMSVIKPATPVLFLDTEMLFPETLAYQKEVAEKLGLSNVQIIRPNREELFAQDPDGILHLADADKCCGLRKRKPLLRALNQFDTWMTGRKRFQTADRSNLEFFENDADRRIKINPLVHWTKQDVEDYIINNRLPKHPMVSRSFPSIGCMPCTTEVAEGEDYRSGRWRGTAKAECGIHLSVDQAATVGPRAVIVTDDGFAPDSFANLEGDDVLTLTSDVAVEQLGDALKDVALIRVAFPTFADGRPFTIARQLRRMGYDGRLRAYGQVISDQYSMARRSGFDEVEISAELAARQPESEWLFRNNWRANDYQNRVRTKKSLSHPTL